MGLSLTLYEINKSDFVKIKNDVSLFNYQLSESYELFNKNFLGLEFILKKTLDEKQAIIIEEVFIPTAYLGEVIDHEDITQMDFSKILNSHINYLDPTLIKKINIILNSISTKQFTDNYNAYELNENEIYPNIWHNDESPNYAFNKTDITKAIEQLKSIMKRSEKNGSYIFVFSG